MERTRDSIPGARLSSRRARPGAGPGGPRRRAAGFTLLEVMIALGLLAFGILGVTAGQLAAMKLSTRSRYDSAALYLAEQQMETFQAMAAADVAALVSAPDYPDDPANPIDPDPADADPTVYQRSWQITPDTPEPGVMALTIQVSWVDALGNTQSQRLHGFKADL